MADVEGEFVGLPAPGYSAWVTEYIGDDPTPPGDPVGVDIPYAGPRIDHYDPLGGGIVRPFYRAEHGDFCSTQGVAEVMSNVGQILGTQRGVLPWRTDFGSDLETLRHRRNNAPIRELAAVYVSEALGRWDRRVALRGLTVEGGSRTDLNELGIRASIHIEGVEGPHRLLVPMRRPEGAVSDGPAVRNLATGARLSRGMAYLRDLHAPPVSMPQLVLNVGLVRPFRRVDKDFQSASGVQGVLSNVWQVFGTAPGTLPWRTDFGSELERLRHRRNEPALAELARHFVEEALLRWEPRSRARKVEVLRTAATDNSLTIRVACEVAWLESREQLFEVTLK